MIPIANPSSSDAPTTAPTKAVAHGFVQEKCRGLAKDSGALCCAKTWSLTLAIVGVHDAEALLSETGVGKAAGIQVDGVLAMGTRAALNKSRTGPFSGRVKRAESAGVGADAGTGISACTDADTGVCADAGTGAGTGEGTGAGTGAGSGAGTGASMDAGAGIGATGLCVGK
jgi:hypothetical protein